MSVTAGGAGSVRDLLSGRRRGPVAVVLRFLLLAATPLYRLALALRSLAYAVGIRRTYPPAVPVVSVGNLTAGGTGKSPFVAYLVDRLAERGLRAGVVSRGYRSRDGELGDEGKDLLAARPDVIRVEEPDRVYGSALAVSRGAEVIVLDDAFQHRACARDLDIVLIDAMEPFGHGHLLPRGLLREPLSALGRADVIVITRADLISPDDLGSLADRLEALAPDALIVRAVHAPRSLTGLDAGATRDLAELRGRRVAALSGIGNPEAFEATLRLLGAEVVATIRHPDHHDHTERDLGEAETRARDAGAAWIVTTSKDAVKLEGLEAPMGEPPVLVLAVEIGILDAEERLLAMLLERVAPERDDD